MLERQNYEILPNYVHSFIEKPLPSRRLGSTNLSLSAKKILDAVKHNS